MNSTETSIGILIFKLLICWCLYFYFSSFVSVDQVIRSNFLTSRGQYDITILVKGVTCAVTALFEPLY
ncbi:hypothetical protein VNO78_22229 [Psophocarpus tetragonolobus]|uniref:Uncharacterized protein n=1 Tax=Psophocarpus tetragonolobus TaxID=3891 RepID=A0AAN9XIV9_PSOTE